MFFTSELGKGFIISDEEEVRPLLRSRSYIANIGIVGEGGNKFDYVTYVLSFCCAILCATAVEVSRNHTSLSSVTHR